MSRYTSLGHLSVTFQNSFGNYQNNSFYTIPITGENLTEKVERLPTSRYASFYQRRQEPGKRLMDGGFNFYFDPFTSAMAMKVIFSQYYNSSSGSSINYKYKVHSADFNNNLAVQPLTIEVNKNEDNSYYFYDMQANKLSIQCKAHNFFKASLGFIGRDFRKDTKTSPYYDYSNKFITYQTSIVIDGVAVKDIIDFNINIDNGLTGYHTLQTCGTPFKIKRTREPLIQINGSMLVQNDSMWQAFTNDTEKQIVFNVENNEGSFKVDMPLVNIIDYLDPTEGKKPYVANFTGEAAYHQGSGTVVDITVTNSYVVGPSLFILDDVIFGVLDGTYNLLG